MARLHPVKVNGPLIVRRRRASGSVSLERIEHLLRMTRDLYLGPDGADAAILAYEERGALDAHIVAPIHAFLHPDAIGL